MIITIPSTMSMTGTVTAVSRRVCPKSTKVICSCGQCDASELGKILVQVANNTIFSGWTTQVVKDIATGSTGARPRIMAFSKDVVPVSPPPSALTNEFRAATNVFYLSSTMQILATLGATEFNTPAGTIKSLGFYYGEDVTTTVGTGTLASLINDLSVSKDSSTEVTFQYDITFASAT